MKFVCDSMLGRLAKYLRILGLDTIYYRPSKKDKFVIEEPYVFFTRRKKPPFKNAVFISSDNVIDQLKEIKHLIQPHVDPQMIMSRCISCNVVLEPVEKEEVQGLVPEYVFHTQKEFRRCRRCKRIYWSGSHVEHMSGWIREILGVEVE